MNHQEQIKIQLLKKFQWFQKKGEKMSELIDNINLIFEETKKLVVNTRDKVYKIVNTEMIDLY